MGLKPGEKIERLGQIRVVDVRREPLNLMETEGVPPNKYGYDEAAKEGFPQMSGSQFVSMFCEHMGGSRDQEITRIEFDFVNETAVV